MKSSGEMKSRYTEEMKLWLFDLAHDNLTNEQILQGFIKHYVLFNCGMRNVHDDMHFHTLCSIEQQSSALSKLNKVLEKIANG